MTGDEIFRAMEIGVENAASPEAAILVANFSHMQVLWLHARTLSAHCECLGMNAENSWAVCTNQSIPYTQAHYLEVMQKWGLVDEKGESII